ALVQQPGRCTPITAMLSIAAIARSHREQPLHLPELVTSGFDHPVLCLLFDRRRLKTLLCILFAQAKIRFGKACLYPEALLLRLLRRVADDSGSQLSPADVGHPATHPVRIDAVCYPLIATCARSPHVQRESQVDPVIMVAL